jgi:hypothetical protein
MGAPKIVQDKLMLWIDANKVDLNGPGKNDPLTTRWSNLAGIPIDGVLNNFNPSSPVWIGDGTPENPYRLRSNPGNNYIYWQGFGVATKSVNLPKLTVEAWLILRAYPTSSSIIIQRPVYGNEGADVWGVGISQNGYLYLERPYVSLSAGPLSLGKIYHVVGIFDNIGKIYINGSVAISGNMAPGGYFPDEGTMGLLALNKVKDNPQYGLPIDLITLRIYSKVLTDNEVLQNYNAGYIWNDYYDKTQITTTAITKYSNYTSSTNYASHIELYDENGLKINTLVIDGSKVYWTDTTNGKTLICKISGSDMDYLPRKLSTIRLVDSATNGNTLAISRLNTITFNNATDEYRFYLQFAFKG